MHGTAGPHAGVAGRLSPAGRLLGILLAGGLWLLGGCAAPVPPPAAELVRRYAAPGPRGDPWGPFVRAAAAEFAVPEPLIYAVMMAESRGCQWLNGHPMRSLAGEIGLMQVPPAIFELIRSRIGGGADPYLPRDNIRAGAYSLSVMAGNSAGRTGWRLTSSARRS